MIKPSSICLEGGNFAQLSASAVSSYLQCLHQMGHLSTAFCYFYQDCFGKLGRKSCIQSWNQEETKQSLGGLFVLGISLKSMNLWSQFIISLPVLHRNFRECMVFLAFKGEFILWTVESKGTHIAWRTRRHPDYIFLTFTLYFKSNKCNEH